mmetsp:Transcript_886/g.4025  ORF Transcript_886/g.4025 Transcript_886/m.4025 type:complete len:236 (-) Transcript_886:17-724(-)
MIHHRAHRRRLRPRRATLPLLHDAGRRVRVLLVVVVVVHRERQRFGLHVHGAAVPVLPALGHRHVYQRVRPRLRLVEDPGRGVRRVGPALAGFGALQPRRDDVTVAREPVAVLLAARCALPVREVDLADAIPRARPGRGAARRRWRIVVACADAHARRELVPAPALIGSLHRLDIVDEPFGVAEDVVQLDPALVGVRIRDIEAHRREVVVVVAHIHGVHRSPRTPAARPGCAGSI